MLKKDVQFCVIDMESIEVLFLFVFYACANPCRTQDNVLH